MSEKPHAPSDDHGHGHDAHGHHGSVFIQHHYDDAQHQFDSGKLGIWLFLAQEVLFFSALFVAYVLYRHHHPEIYSYAHKYLDVKYGAINTAVLIFSSLTAAWAVRAAQLKQKTLLIACLAATIACALGFLCIKYIEYSHKVHEHILFGRYFDPCVSSGNRPLLTKNNRCAGHESTVVWNAGTARAQAGCFPDYAIDQDKREGVQASCSVSETKVTLDHSGKVTAEVPGRAIVEQCPEWRPSSQPQVKAKYPCWRPGYQPAVCGMGYSYTWIEGSETKFAGPYTTQDECEKDQKKKAAELKAASPPSEATACLRSGSVGVIVEYGDHEIRPHDLRIKAECKGPPITPPSTVDPLADKDQHLVLGQSSAAPPGVSLRESKHDAHEREAAGPPPEHTNMFFTIYFAMTGLHGVHVLVGVFVFIWLLIRAIKGHFTPDYFGPVDFAALYWHIVDLIWIFLFPLLYLIH